MFMAFLGIWTAAVLEAIFIVTFPWKGITKLIGIYEECNRKTPSFTPLCCKPL